MSDKHKIDLIRVIDDFAIIKDEKQLEELTKGKAADAYVHFKNKYYCNKAIVEIKASKMDKALRQLEVTMNALKRNAEEVNKVIIVMTKKPSKVEKKLYEIRKNGILYSKTQKRIVKINDITVEVRKVS